MKLIISIKHDNRFEELSAVLKELHEYRVNRVSGRCVWCKNYFELCSCDVQACSDPKYPDYEAIVEYRNDFPVTFDNNILL